MICRVGVAPEPGKKRQLTCEKEEGLAGSEEKGCRHLIGLNPNKQNSGASEIYSVALCLELRDDLGNLS
jgi:hypothetical protein